MNRPALEVEQGSDRYPVYIGSGLLEQLSAIGDDVHPRGERILVISPRVRALHGARVLSSFPAGTLVVEFDDGEERKTLDNVEGLLDRLIAAGARRDTLIYVVGGGVVGDAAGFAASILLRGVGFVHVPTTLLSQVDSSIGGKLGVNHLAGKNLIGSFAAPAAVVSDVSVLHTLERRDLLSGTYEAMKSGIIGDPELFELTEEKRESGSDAMLEQLVLRSVRVKASIVARDDRESSDRRLLNYGHTIGHAIETAARYRGVTHGEAVAWGMLAANAIALGRGLLSPSDAERIGAAIRRHGPATLSHLSRDAVIEATGYDKKFQNRKRVMVLPETIGRCTVVEDITAAEIEAGVDVALDEMRRMESA